MSTILAAGDVWGPINTALADFKSDVPTAVGAGVVVGVAIFGAKRLYGVFKSLAR